MRRRLNQIEANIAHFDELDDLYGELNPLFTSIEDLSEDVQDLVDMLCVDDITYDDSTKWSECPKCGSPYVTDTAHFCPKRHNV